MTSGKPSPHSMADVDSIRDRKRGMVQLRPPCTLSTVSRGRRDRPA